MIKKEIRIYIKKIKTYTLKEYMELYSQLYIEYTLKETPWLN